MSDIAVTFGVVAAMVVLFASNLVPVAVVAIGAALALYATGILDLREALAGFGDPTVLFIGSLLVVSASLEVSGVSAWAGKLLIRHAGTSRLRLLILTMLLGASLTAAIGSGGAVAALVPVVVLVAVRLRIRPSRLLMPLAFAAHAGSMLVLTGSVVTVLLSNAARDAGKPGFGFFELTVIGVPLLAGTIAIVTLLGERLLPDRATRALPEDLSKHSRTLADQYRLFDGLFKLEVTASSPFVGAPAWRLERTEYVGLSLVGVQQRQAAPPGSGGCLEAGDTLLMRGEDATVGAFAAAKGLLYRPAEAPAEVRRALFNSTAGFAEIVIPPRSGAIGETVFPGMITQTGDVIVLAIQRRGEDVGPGDTTLAAGDTLLLQGTWEALDDYSHNPDVLLVDAPDMVRRQAVPLGSGAGRAIAVLATMVLLLASGAIPPAAAGLLAACAVVLLGIIKVEQAYRAVNWTALIMVASLIPLSVAMDRTGAAALMADTLVKAVGGYHPQALLAGMFVLTALLCQAISSSAATLIIIPVALAASVETGLSKRAILVTVAVAAAASFLTPIAASANLMVQGPGGYRFGDYWKLGLPVMGWFFLIGTFLVPMLWPL